MQELHEPSINKTTPPVEIISELLEVMEIRSDWPFMIYLRTGGLPEDKDEHE
jgi:hypothetical protein